MKLYIVLVKKEAFQTVAALPLKAALIKVSKKLLITILTQVEAKVKGIRMSIKILNGMENYVESFN